MWVENSGDFIFPLYKEGKPHIINLNIKMFDTQMQKETVHTYMETEHLAEELLTLTRIIRPLRTAEMTPQQYWLMRYLHEHGSASLGELAHGLGISPGSATTACKRLEKAKLITRQRRTDDERIVQIALTEQGYALIEAGRKRRRTVLMSLLGELSAEEQEQLQHLIGRLLEVAEAQGFGE